MSDQAKIYLATRGEYSDYRVCHAFARREDAESYSLGDEVLELVLHDGPVEVRYWHGLIGRCDQPERDGSWPAVANPAVYSELRDFDGDEKHATHSWDGERLYVQGWDKQLVMKVYSEQRAQHLAAREGVA
jgi:hypothetical protein